MNDSKNEIMEIPSLRRELKDLTLLDSFLFDKVLENRITCQAMLEIILGHEIPDLEENVAEKIFSHLPGTRGVRLDLYSMDANKVIYNAEAQKKKLSHIPKRSRYYQSIMDSSFLPPGTTNYQDLPDTYIIFISPFDLFDKGKYVYTIRPMCEEVPDIRFDDGTTRIFLNTRGCNEAEVRPELMELLHYMESADASYSQKTTNAKIKSIAEYAEQIKKSEEVGVSFLRAQEEFEYYAEELAQQLAQQLAQERAQQLGQEIGQQLGQEIGRQIGQEIGEKIAEEKVRTKTRQITELVLKLTETNRFEDLKRLHADPEYLTLLLAEFGMSSE